MYRRRLTKTKASLLVEYALLWIIVGVAVAGTFTYLVRSASGFIERTRREFNDWRR
jgi:hypothetical protein